MSNNNSENTLETVSRLTSSKPDSANGSLAKGSLVIGLLAGLTASACCAGPLILLMLGISGSWIVNLSALEPYRPFFILLAVVFLGFAYRKIFLKPKLCEIDAVCATQLGKHSQQIIFWITALIVMLSVSFPWYAPFLFD